MPFYRVEMDDGTVYRVEADSQPSEQEVLDVLGELDAKGEGETTSQQPQQPPIQQKIQEVLKTLATSPTTPPSSPMEALANQLPPVARVAYQQLDPLTQVIETQAPRLGEQAGNVVERGQNAVLGPLQPKVNPPGVYPRVQRPSDAEIMARSILPATAEAATTQTVQMGTPRNIMAAEVGIAAAKSPLGTKVLSMKLSPQKAEETIAKIPDKLFRGGLTKEEALKMEKNYGGNTGGIVNTVKDIVVRKDQEANKAYQTAYNNFTEDVIRSRALYRYLKQKLTSRKWITDSGEPTLQYKQGLGQVDRLNDQMTKLYLDLKESKGLMTKEDFARFRDNLSGFGWDDPFVQQARNALYQDAETAGMTGIKAARDLERKSKQMTKKFLNTKGDLTINESKLSKIGTESGISQAELQHIKELEDYTGISIIKDATNINKLNKIKKALSIAKEEGLRWGTRAAIGGTAIGTGVGLGLKLGEKFR